MSHVMRRALRGFCRIPALFVWLFWQGLISLRTAYSRDPRNAIRGMARQTRSWGAGLLRIFGGELRIHGDPETYRKTGGLVVSNHLGYFDIFVHAAVFGLRFTPKDDIRSWAVLGWYVGLTHPIWINRRSPQKSKDALKEFRTTLEMKVPLIVYPEGTSTSGKEGLLPFKATSFESVVGTSIPIQPVLTVYSVEQGDQTPCWYGDDELFPHLWSLLGNRRIQIDLYLLPQIHAESKDRKELAAFVHERLTAAYQEHHAAQSFELGIPL